MAYFPNGINGSCFDAQCFKCKYELEPCPIALVQMEYNYDQVNNELATKIITDLVRDDGTCNMKEMMDNYKEKHNKE